MCQVKILIKNKEYFFFESLLFKFDTHRLLQILVDLGGRTSQRFVHWLVDRLVGRVDRVIKRQRVVIIAPRVVVLVQFGFFVIVGFLLDHVDIVCCCRGFIRVFVVYGDQVHLGRSGLFFIRHLEIFLQFNLILLKKAFDENQKKRFYETDTE